MGIKCEWNYSREDLERLGFKFDEEDEKIIRYIKTGVPAKITSADVYYIWRKEKGYAQIEAIKKFWTPCTQAFPSDAEIMDIAERTGLERLCFFVKE